MSSLFNKKAEHQLTIKDEYDRLFNVVLRNTVFNKLTDSEAERLASTLDQHLALLNIGGHLINHGFFVKFALSDWRRPLEDFIVRRMKEIDEHNINIMGLTMSTPDYPNVRTIANELKKQRPELRIVVGGCHPTFLAEQILKEAPSIDFAAIGPGDSTMIKLASDVPCSEIPGLAYRLNGEIKVNPAQYDPNDFLGFSYPYDYDYALAPYRKFPLARVFSQAGCNLGCYYCADGVWQGKIHKIGITKFRQEIFNLYNSRDSRYYYVHNQDALSQMDHFRKVYPLFAELRKEDKRVHLSLQVTSHSVRKITEEELTELGESGVNWFQIGLESIDPSVNAKTSKELFEKALQKIKKYVPNAFTTVYLLVGLPGDSRDKAMYTMEYVESLSKRDLITAPFVT